MIFDKIKRIIFTITMISSSLLSVGCNKSSEEKFREVEKDIEDTKHPKYITPTINQTYQDLLESVLPNENNDQRDILETPFNSNTNAGYINFGEKDEWDDRYIDTSKPWYKNFLTYKQIKGLADNHLAVIEKRNNDKWFVKITNPNIIIQNPDPYLSPKIMLRKAVIRVENITAPFRDEVTGVLTYTADYQVVWKTTEAGRALKMKDIIESRIAIFEQRINISEKISGRWQYIKSTKKE
jgi:hypothetical protein